MILRKALLALAALAAFAVGAGSQAVAQDAFFAVLNAAQVCNTPQNADPPLCRLGDTDGAGSATVLITGPTSLCVTLIVDNIAFPAGYPTAASLHVGQASYTGPHHHAAQRAARARRG